MFYFAEIVGTKDYRKPEWVTHMEQMQEALKGKYIKIKIKINKSKKMKINLCPLNASEIKLLYET